MNIRQVGKKIKSFGNVKKITNAMQLVSAVKMKKAQERALEGRPYQEFLENAIRNVVQNAETTMSPLLINQKATSNKKLLIVVTSNKGLCGSFNMNLIRSIMKEIKRENGFITIGKKGTVLISQLGGQVLADFSSTDPLDNVSAVFRLALEEYLKGNYNEVVLVYNRFVSTLRSNPTEKTILPLVSEMSSENNEKPEIYQIEPDPESVLDALLKSFVEEQIRYAVIESDAGEHSARMIAMQNATDNAENVIYNLTLLKNKLRQQSITYELLDMITAKESVEAS